MDKQASEKAIVELRNEKLEEDNRHKTQQLASSTMHLVQKNEILLKVKEELKKVETQTQNPNTRKVVRQLIKLVNNDIKLDEDWEQFAHHFDQVHSDFLKRLRETHPQLSPKDHRLCAYLRMNLATKERAPLMTISVRGVEISRYRLRKKLNLDAEANLVEFILAV